MLSKFRSGIHGLNEELGRHRGREGNKECELCGNECESVSHLMWECSACSSNRADLLLKLQEKLYREWVRTLWCLDSLYRKIVLDSKLWEEHFDSLCFVKD